jgi:LacI family transcriptional regulator
MSVDDGATDLDPLVKGWSGTVTLYDVARASGVHPSTVSRALDPTKHSRVKAETRERIIRVADELGYRPDLVARSLQSGRTGTVGVILADIGNTFITPLVHGIAAALESSRAMPTIAETQDDHARMLNILDHMLSRRVDGIVAVAARAADQQALEAAAKVVPVVLASRPLEETQLVMATHDDHEGGRLVAEHLYQLGHRTVAQLLGPNDVLNFPRRAEGFRQVVSDRGLHELTVDVCAERPVTEEGERLMELLLDNSPHLPTGVFAHNDLMALGALSVLRRRGLRVPEDISLLGCNDLPLVGHLTPPLSTVRLRPLELGKVAGDMVVRMLSGEQPASVSLGVSLIPRGSSRRLDGADRP